MDIVEQLRDGVNRHYGKDPAGLLNEAADEIERLRELINELRKNSIYTKLVQRVEVYEEVPLMYAREALGEKE